jgi:two-component sensor histidine kinase
MKKVKNSIPEALKCRIVFVLLFLFSSFNLIAQEIQFTELEKQWIADHQIIEFGYDNRWEPYEIYSAGQYGGIISDYIGIVEEKTGIKMRPLPDMDWSKSIKGLSDGSLTVIPGFVETPLREQKFELSNPYINDPIVIVASKDATYFSSLEDLKGKTVSLSKNYYAVELIKNQYPDVKIKEYESVEECLKAIIDGESDAFVGKLNVITYYINHYGFENIKIVGTTPFKYNGICFAINAEHKTFKGIINKVIAQITPEQKHQIRQKWIAGERGGIYSTAYIIGIFVVLIIVLIGLAIFFFWNRTLKKQIKINKETELQLKSLLIEVKQGDDEKKVLLQEIHHRVKNNLQIVSSMLNLQSNTTRDEKTRNALKEAMDRVSSIALVHKKMYQSPSSNKLNIKGYIETLFKELVSQDPKY